MYKRIVLFFICLGFACGAFAQEIDTTGAGRSAGHFVLVGREEIQDRGYKDYGYQEL